MGTPLPLLLTVSCPEIYDRDCRAHTHEGTTHTESDRPTAAGPGGRKERFPNIREGSGSWSFCRRTRRIWRRWSPLSGQESAQGCLPKRLLGRPDEALGGGNQGPSAPGWARTAGSGRDFRAQNCRFLLFLEAGQALPPPYPVPLTPPPFPLGAAQGRILVNRK